MSLSSWWGMFNADSKSPVACAQRPSPWPSGIVGQVKTKRSVATLWVYQVTQHRSTLMSLLTWHASLNIFLITRLNFKWIQFCVFCVTVTINNFWFLTPFTCSYLSKSKNKGWPSLKISLKQDQLKSWQPQQFKGVFFFFCYFFSIAAVHFLHQFKHLHNS